MIEGDDQRYVLSFAYNKVKTEIPNQTRILSKLQAQLYMAQELNIDGQEWDQSF